MPRLLPPGPPPGRPPGPPPGPPPGLPPGPPPRGPPRSLAPPLSLFPPPLNSNVLSAPPNIVQRQKGTSQDASQTTIEKRAGGATISAKPQIINPKAEVTRFVPTALRVRRDKSGAVPGAAAAHHEKAGAGALGRRMGAVSQPSMKTKDQVYEAFMREMEGLL
uniref:WW domain binding protein 11 n=1 Tax=Oryzias sinensis TaxID=183150 RepID=A0A8C7Z379_9TELE